MALLPYFRALHIAATVLIGGALAFNFLILRRCGEAAHDAAVAPVLDRWIAGQCAWGVAIGLVSWAGWLAAIAMSMSGLPAHRALSPEILGTVMARTTFGHVWVIRMALFVVLGALAMRRAARAFAFTVALTLVGSLAWTGHALGTNPVHVWVDAMHLLAAAAWLGMLPLLWLVTNTALTEDARWRDLGIQCARHFYLPGLVAVLVLAASGVANTSWMVDSISDLFATTYGRVLSMKLALFALMLMLATVNRFFIVPRTMHATSKDSLRALRATVFAELVLGVAVVGVVAWLGVTPPVAHEHVMHQMQGM